MAPVSRSAMMADSNAESIRLIASFKFSFMGCLVGQLGAEGVQLLQRSPELDRRICCCDADMLRVPSAEYLLMDGVD
jgi:hypothetical protein